ncbi:hypothetical protein Hdeb2414_s0200g00830851 [Helianthus debilis subsp. tardiflorus]
MITYTMGKLHTKIQAQRISQSTVLKSCVLRGFRYFKTRFRNFSRTSNFYWVFISI